jgi:hypothetical protein
MNTDMAALLAFFAVLQLAAAVMLAGKRWFALLAGYAALLVLAWPAAVVAFNAGYPIVGHLLWLIPVVCVIACAGKPARPA